MKPFLKPDDDDKHVMLSLGVLLGAMFLGIFVVVEAPAQPTAAHECEVVAR